MTLRGTALFEPVTSGWGETFTHTPCTSDRERLVVERAETQRLRSECHAQRVLLEQVAWDALAVLSGAGIATPAEGYIKASFCLKGDIQRLVRERDAAIVEVGKLTRRLGQVGRSAHGRELTEEQRAEAAWRLDMNDGVSEEGNG